MVLEFSANLPSPYRRQLRINPKSLRAELNTASASLLLVSGPHGRVVLEVDLDGKAPIGRIYGPSVSVACVGSPVAISLIDSSAVQSLREIKFHSLHDTEQDTMTEAQIVRRGKYMRAALEGVILTSGEVVALPMGGKHRCFRVEFDGVMGFVTALTSIAGSGSESANKTGLLGFKQVGGLSNVIQELVSVIKKPLFEQQLYKSRGLSPPRGILLHGPPGTGKTLLAKALAFELESCFVVNARGTDMTGSDSDSKIHDFFALTRRRCRESGYSCFLLFIDEIDSLCPSRDSGVTEAERRAVAALLTELDGISNSQEPELPFVVIGATNRVNSIDPALRRPGRFEREIEIAPPNQTERVEILKIFANSSFGSMWTPSEDELRIVAANTHGFVGADLRSVISHACLKSMEHGRLVVTHEDVMNELVHVRPSALRELAVTVPKTKWTDIGGYQDVKSQLIEAVIWPCTHSEEFRRLNVEPPKGVLLYGPPGCSKTMMARAVATESSMNFIAVKGPEIFSKWVGESEQAIREIFRKARQSSPCVVFFDEIDALATSRDGGDGGVSSRVLTQLLTEMDGVSSLKHVVVIAATNRPHVLDPALLRPGRLDRLVFVGLPDEEARKEIWAHGLRKIPHDLDTGENEPVKELVGLTNGYSGAEIVMALKEAAVSCIKEQISNPPPLDADSLCDELNSLKIGETKPKDVLQWKHLRAALEKVRPRTDANTLSVLLGFQSHA